MRIAFNKVSGQYVVFDVEIENTSEHSILIEPERFYYQTGHYPGDSLWISGDSVITSGIDPEKKLIAIDQSIARENADYETDQCIDGCITFLDLFAAIATIDEEQTEEERREAEERRRDRAIARTERAILHEELTGSLEAEKEYWEVSTIRKTELQPEEYLTGKVYFPVNRQAAFVTFYFPVETSHHRFVFSQVKYGHN